jgi:hypothetical protein
MRASSRRWFFISSCYPSLAATGFCPANDSLSFHEKRVFTLPFSENWLALFIQPTSMEKIIP